MSINKKSPRHRTPDAFRVERLEPRVMLSADPVLAPLTLALLPHATLTTHVAPLTVDADAAAMHPLFNAASMSAHQTVMQPVQPVSAHAAQGASVATTVHLATTASATTAAASVMAPAASTSLFATAGRMHVMSAAPGSLSTLTTDIGPVGSYSVSGSVALNKSPVLTITVGAGVSLGGAGDWIYGTAAGQNLTIARSGAGGPSVDINAQLPAYAVSGQFALHNLTIGSLGAPVGNVNFHDLVNLTGDLTIYTTGTVTFGSTLTLNSNGNLKIIGATNVTFNGAVTLNNIDGDDPAGTGTVATAAGNITLAANHIVFPTGANAFTGSGTLNITTATAHNPIFFADPNITFDSNALVIANADLRYWGATFTNIYIGSANGGHADSTTAGAVSIGGTMNGGLGAAPTVLDNITFYGTTVTVTSPLAVTTPAYTFYGVGNVTFDATSDITLANTVVSNAGTGAIVATSASGAITESGTATYLKAGSLVATAVTGITLPSTQLTTLSATNSGTTGSISVTENANGGALGVLQALQSSAGSNGNIAISTTSGGLSVDGTGVVTAGSGNVSLVAQGTAAPLSVNAVVTAHAGGITMTAPGLVTLNALTSNATGAINVTSSLGTVNVLANVTSLGGALALHAAGDITMAANMLLSSVNAGNTGTIALVAGGNDVLATLAAGGTMAVTANTGSISSSMLESPAAGQLNFTGTTARTTLTAATGIGSRNHDIQTSVSEITLTNSLAGDVFINQTQTGALQLGTGSGAAVTLGGTTGTASIVTTDGGILVNGTITSTATGGTAGQTGNILLQTSRAAAASADIAVAANVSSASGSIELYSAGSINVGNSAAINIAANAAGQTVYLQAVASVVFLGTSQVNAAGNVWVKATGGSVALGEIFSTGGIVAVDSGNLITDVQSNASQTVANITAANIRLSAAGAIGTSANAVEVANGSAGVTFAGASAGGGLYLLSTSNLTVDAVAATPVYAIGPTASPTQVGDAAALSSVAVYGAGNLVLKSAADLTVARAIGLAAPVILGVPVSTQVRLDATGRLDIEGDIGNIGGAFTAYTGNMSLMGSTGVTLGAGHVVSTLAGTLDVESGAGSVTLNAGSLLKSGSGAIRVQAAQGVGVARVQTAGNVALTATAGSITDTNGNVDGTAGIVNVTAAGLRLKSGTDVGTTTDELQVSVGTLSAAAAAGSVYVNDNIAVAIDSVAVSVNQVSLAGTVATSSDAAQSGIVTSGANGNIVLESASAPITINTALAANGSGNVLVQTYNRTAPIDIEAAISSGTGHIEVKAFGDVDVAQAVTTGGAGNIDIEAADNLVMTGNTLVSSGTGNIYLGGQSVAVARVSTGGDVALFSSTSILDANGNSDAAGAGIVNVSANHLSLSANGVLGTSTDALQTHVNTVAGAAGFAGAGGIYLLNDQAETVGIASVSLTTLLNSGGTDSKFTGVFSGLVSWFSGNIVVQTTAGDLSVPQIVQANGNGNVLMQSKAGALTIGAQVESSGSTAGNGAGSLSLLGATGVNFGAGAVASAGSGTIDVESGAAVSMGTSSLLQTTSGNIGVVAATSVQLARVETNVAAAITANGGSITDADAIPNGSVGPENVIASAVRLKATGAIGSGADALRLQVTNLTASAGAGGVFLTGDQGTTVSHATVVVNQVAQDGTAGTTVTQALQNGVTTTAGGAIVLGTTAGNLTLSSTATTLPAVVASGGGNVLLQATAGAVNVNASVFSNGSGAGNGTGHITVEGAFGVAIAQVGATASVATGSGTIDIESGIDITMAANALVRDGTGAVRLAAAQNVAVGKIATSGNVGIVATAGAVTDANGNLTSNPSGVIDVSADGLNIVAGANAGTITDALRTHVNSITANTTSGGIYVVNDQSVRTYQVEIVVQKVAADGTAATTIDTWTSALSSDVAGDILLRATSGDIHLTGPVSDVSISGSNNGNVLVQADAGRITADSEVETHGAGSITLRGAQGVAIGTDFIWAMGTGSIDIESSAGSVAMVLGTQVLAGGDIRIAAAQDIAVGQVESSHDVSLTAAAGSISDAYAYPDGTTFVSNVAGDGLRLSAGTGVGTGTDALRVSVNTLSESVGAGGGYVVSNQSVTVGSVSATVNKTAMDGTTTPLTDTAQAGLVSHANGNLVLQALGGDVTLTSLSPSIAAVNANGTGNVLLQTLGGTINANASVYSDGGTGAGNISVLGAAGVDIGATGIVATVGSGGGTVDVASSAGDVTMSAHSVLASGGADVRVTAAGNVAVGQVESGADVSLVATAGSVLDANGNLNSVSGHVLDVQASGLRIVAGQAAGTSSDALQTQVDSLTASTGSDLFLVNDQSFAVDTAATTIQRVGLDGGVTVLQDAPMVGASAGADSRAVLQASTGDLSVDAGVSTSGTGHVLLQAVTGAVHVGSVVSVTGLGAGAISIIGATGVDLSSNEAVIASDAGTLDIESSGGSVQMGASSLLQAGTVRVIAAHDVDLARISAAGNVALTATAGSIGNTTHAASNVQAQALFLSAGTAAGIDANPLLLTVSTLSAQVGGGGLSVFDDGGFSTGSVSATVSQVGLDGGLPGVTTATASDAIASAGPVKLEALGNINLASASAAVAAINANGSGNVLVESDAASINVTANVRNGSGNTVGGISLLAAQDVDIGTASVAVNVVDGAGAMDIEAIHGNIVMSTASALQASVGTVRVVANGSLTLGQVQATGNTLAQAVTGTLNANANVTVGAGTSAGTLTLHAAHDLVVAAGVTVSDGAGAVAITSDLGNVQMATSSLLQSASGTVRVVGGTAVTLGQVSATGNTWAQALGDSLTLNNTVADGTGAQAGTLTLLATGGDVVFAAGVAASNGAGRVDVESLTGNVVMNTGSRLQSAGGTVDVLAAQAVTLGRLLANANTLVQAQGGRIAVDDTVQSGSGSLSLLATGDIDVAAVSVGSGSGSLDVESAGSVAMNAAATLASASGAVRVLAAQDVAVGHVATAGNVAITATAGSIVDASGGLDVAASGIRLAAGNGVGTAGQALEIQGATLSASAGAGGVTLLSTGAVAVGSVAVTVNQVAASGSASPVTDAAQAGIVTRANGSVSLEASSGDITLTPSGGNAIAANGSGSVLVQALAASGNVDALAGITSGTGAIDVEAGHDIVLYTPASGAAQISTALPGLVTVHAINGSVFSGGATAPGQTVDLNQNQLTLQSPLTGTNNQLNIGPATVASNPDAVVVGGPASGGSGALYLSQQQTGLIQTGFKDVDIGSSIPGQAVVLVGQDASGQPSANVFVNPLTLTANGAGGTVSISGGLQATTLDVQGSGTGTALASAVVSTRGAILVNDNVTVTGATSLTSGTGGAADLTINGTITGTGANSLSMNANGGNIVVTGAVAGLGGVNVSQAASLTFQSTFAVVGNVVINTTGSVTFDGGVTIAAGGSLTINGATQVTFAAGADLTQAGNVKIATNVLNLLGGAGSIRGTGVLTLTAATASGAIHVGDTSVQVTGALKIGLQAIGAIAPGFAQVVIGTVDTSTGHASTGAGAVDIVGNTDLSGFAAPVAVYASTLSVDAGGTGVHVGGALTLDAVGLVSLGSDVVTTVAGNITIASATSTVTQAAGTKLGSHGGNVTLTTGNSSNATLAVIDTRATGSDVGAVVTLDVGNGRVIDVNADANVNVYAAAVSMKGYGLTNTAGSNQDTVLKVRAPVVYVAAPTGVVVADAGQDGRTNYNAFDHGSMIEELIAVGATTRVTLPGDAVAGGGGEVSPLGVTDVSLMHAAAAETFMSRLFVSSVSRDGVSLSAADSSSGDAGYVLGSVASQPSVSGVASHGEGAYDFWTESLEA